VTATGNAGRKHAVPIDTDFGDERVDHPRQELHVVDVERVGAVVTDDVAPVPVALVPIGIHDGKPACVGKALEPIPRVDSDSSTVLTRAVHHHDQRCAFRQSSRYVRLEGPLQPAHLDGSFGQRAGQSWKFRSGRVDEVAEQCTSQGNNDDQAQEEEA
jgi:hypothetical protein